MKNILWILLFAVVIPWEGVAREGQHHSVIELGSDRELFVDQYLVDTLINARMQLHEPRDEGPVLFFDKPWEGPFSAYCTIIQDGGKFRAYYRGVPSSGSDGNANETTCYAESEDGVNWTKPELGLYKVHETDRNNVILSEAAPVTHNFCPFLDDKPGIPGEEKYKALGGTGKSGLIAYVSPDGIHWTKKQDEPVLTDGKFDSQNVAFWSDKEQKYVAYFRIWTKSGYSGYRSVGRATSDDFIHWSATEPMTFGETPLQHLYTNQTHPYFRAPQIYVAIAARFMPGRQVVSEKEAAELGVDPKYYKDCSDAVFMTTRGGSEYDRTFMEGFIKPGIGLKNWVSRTNYPALNVVQTGVHEMSVYVNQDYAQATAHLHRYSLRLDGFASVTAPFEGGEVLTKPFTFSGKGLSLNFATSAAGQVRVEVTDVDGKVLKGFSREDCREMIGNEVDKEVKWGEGSSLSTLEGKVIRLRFVLADADLYSFVFK